MWGLESDEMTNMCLRGFGREFASLPVLTFKMLARDQATTGTTKAERHTDSDLIIGVHHMQQTSFCTG